MIIKHLLKIENNIENNITINIGQKNTIITQ